AGAAHATVMVDRVGRGALGAGDDAAELDQLTLVVTDKNLVQVLGRETRVPFELSHHVVFLAAHFDAAQVEPAKEDLHGARDIFNAHAERRGAAAIDADAQLGLVYLEADVHAAKVVHAANFVGDVLGDIVQHVQVLVLKDQLEL